MTVDHRAAWNDFWAQNTRGNRAGNRAGGGEAGGCLPARWTAIEAAQKSAWGGFGNDLCDGARVLDLATGDGRVMRWMLATRSDLRPIGIDLAPQLPDAPPGTQVQGGIAMEHLPFEDDRFDAVVSQFGFEYGDTRATAGEIARVLAPDGKVALMVHRGDGPILEHNRERRRQVLWALKDRAIARKVRTVLKDGPTAIDRAAKMAGKVATQGATRFGSQSPAWEIPEAIRRSCLMGRKAGVGSIIETVTIIERQATNEIGRIRSLTRACATADARDTLVDAFAANGLQLRQTQAVREPSGRTLADFLTFE